jgi:aspartate aminotransferase
MLCQAEKKMEAAHLDHEYAPIGGNADFSDLAAKLAFGDNSPVIKNKLVCTHNTC